MAVVINGTTGISGVDGSAGTPALQGGDPDTGIFYGTNTVSISTNGSTAVTVDANGDTTIANDLIVNGTTTQTGSTTFTAQTLFPDGTVSAPSISNTGDVNTGVYFPAADNVAIATGGVAALTADSSQNVSVTNTLVMGSSFKRNRIINGDMRVAQRGTSFSVATTSYTYTLDRYAAQSAAATSTTIAQSSAAASGFTNSIKLQRVASNTGTNAITLFQVIESVNCSDLSGQSVTFSFYAKAGANYSGGALGVKIWTGTTADQGIGALGGWAGGANPINTTQAITSSWTRYTFTGTFGSGVLETAFSIAWTPSGTAGADDSVYITGVQLEVGSVATPYERQIYSEQIAQCQRYYQAVNNIVFFSPSPSSSQIYMATALTFGQVMRATPVITYKSPNNGTANSLEQWGGTDRTVSSSVASSTGLQFAVLASGITTDVILQSNCTFTSEL